MISASATMCPLRNYGSFSGDKWFRNSLSPPCQEPLGYSPLATSGSALFNVGQNRGHPGGFVDSRYSRRCGRLVLPQEAAGEHFVVGAGVVVHGDAHLFHIVGTLGALSRVTNFLHGREQQTDQDSNDSDIATNNSMSVKPARRARRSAKGIVAAVGRIMAFNSEGWRAIRIIESIEKEPIPPLAR
jgi:hypothetical protein